MSEELSNEEGQPQSTLSASQAQSTQSSSQAQSTLSPSQAQSTQSSSQAQSTLSPSQAQSTQSQSLSQSKSQSQPGSSSSSGPTSSSQSSSGSGTLSSVDTIPVTLPSVPEEPEPQPWGRLLPMAQGFRAHNCVEDQYLFGRDSKCDYVLDDPNEPGSKRFRIYSKKHFRIYRENSQVFVEDYSNNGTFVEGQLVGQKRKFPLFNNAVLALSEQRNKVFVFIDLMSDDQSALPQELRDKYFVTQRIGTGVCGEVRMAFSRSTCQEFAVKIINKKNFRSEGTAVRNAQTEIEILKRINHPCLIKTEDFYQTDDSFYIVLELMKGGELFQRIKSQQQLQESVTKLYFYQMLRAVQYLHSNGIIHRDLKPENVLLSSQDDICLIKLTDFNQSRILEEAALMRTLCGTPLYLAPEVFTHATTTGYSLAVDAWSLGVLLFVCLGGYPPFHEDFGHQSIRDQIVRGEFTMVQSKWRNVSDQAKDVVRRLLVVDPCQRMTVEEALQHTWLQDDDMLNTAHRLMYPDADADAAVAAATVAVAAEAEPAGPSRRKRGRGDEDDDEDHPAKRRLTPPSTS